MVLLVVAPVMSVELAWLGMLEEDVTLILEPPRPLPQFGPVLSSKGCY
jgi:hypothetical protein